MAILSTRQFESGGVSEREDGTRTYTASWKVVTNGSTGQKEIADNPLFRTGRTYQFNDEADYSATLDSRNIRLANSNASDKLWIVSCTFTRKPQQSNEDNEETGGGGAQGYSLSIGYKIETREAPAGKFVGIYTVDDTGEIVKKFADTEFRKGGVWGAIVDAANKPKNAALVEDGAMVLSYKAIVSRLPSAYSGDVIGLANKNAFTVTDPTGGRFFKKRFRRHQLKVLNIKMPTLFADTRQIEIGVELAYRKQTWLHLEKNAGDSRLRTVGSPDGFGGTITAGLIAGRPVYEKIRDESGAPTGEHLLNEKGQPVQNASFNPQYLGFLTRNTIDLKKLGFR